MLHSCFLGLCFAAIGQPAADNANLLTVAEKSNYRATARHAEVVALCERLVKASPLIRMGQLGTSVEGRMLPLLILADPPIASAEEAAKTNKLIVFAYANIHAGEVCGKEALPMLARDIIRESHPALLQHLILVFAPIFNADGNERVSKDNRPGQLGPEEGMGQRSNAQGFDLNRDFMKLESPEVQALVRFFRKWDPAVVIDCHTTNGSYHRYTITFDGPRHPGGNHRLNDYVRAQFLPDVSRRLEAKTGIHSFFYGNFNRPHTQWETYPASPRFGSHYVGLRGRIAILSEAYSYAPYKDRVLATRDFVRTILEYTAENRDSLRRVLQQARRSAETAPADREVAVRCESAPLPKPVTVAGYVEVEKEKGKRPVPTTPRDYEVEHWILCKPTLSVRRPYAYLFPPSYAAVVENLLRHGITVEELREDIELDTEAYRLTKLDRSNAAFQKHHLETLTVQPRRGPQRVPAGTIVVRTAQALGALVVQLLEPLGEDSLCAWNFFDAGLAEGKDCPVLRLLAAAPLLTTAVAPLPEERAHDKPITFEVLHGSGSHPNFTGAAISGLTWIEDGEHYLQVKQDRLYKVHAATGRCVPLFDPARVAAALARIPTIDRRTAQQLARQTTLQMNPQQTGALFEHENDLYYASFDGTTAVRLTATPGEEEVASFSPDGKFVAFVRERNLYVVDLATQKERALTTDGGGSISNGKADWVYYEEVFNRNWRAYWWSPDSARIAFIRYDDGPVNKFTVVNHLPTHQEIEATPYPTAGDPNPAVALGIVTVAGGAVQRADLDRYPRGDILLLRAGWFPDSKAVWFYVQDRAQTWLDVNRCTTSGGRPTRLLRETTKAWVNDPGPPQFLKDGSFLLTSERTGWQHLYRFRPTGQLQKSLTIGAWEVRDVLRVDEANGWVYFSGTKDSSIAENAYRVRLDGGALERLTTEPGRHALAVSPTGKYLIDTFSSIEAPTKVALRTGTGKLARWLDTNPVRALDEYRHGAIELVQIKLADGFVLEGSLLKPPGFQPNQKYPVWFMTYAGPHFPTISNSWPRSWGNDQMLAQMGLVVFRCDPRSASGKGAVSTWTAYRQLGVQELKDIDEAIAWLCRFPFVDSARIGMSGHSYGGFMTAYALTHSQRFAAGIAGAPVTDWHNYDTIYTERYMNTPQNNLEGFDKTSVVKAASHLHGRLLLLHGLIDDNVHVQNSVQLIQALQRASKDFEVMFYPTSRHGIFGRHYDRLIVDFIQRTLRPTPGVAPATAEPARSNAPISETPPPPSERIGRRRIGSG